VKEHHVSEQSTALAKVEQTTDVAGKLTVGQRKAFLEVASRSDLGNLSPDQQRGVLLAFGQHTGLRPELGEAMIYQGRLYVTMAGRVRNAHRLGLFEGIKAQPAHATDRRDAGYEEGDIVWMCDVWRRGSARAFRGWGKVTRAEIEGARGGDKTKYTPVAKHPVEMARKRAQYDALRMAFPLDEELSDVSVRMIEGAEDVAAAHEAESEAGEEEREAALELVEEVGASEKPKAVEE
jgi:hypothetical protein